MIRGLQKSRPLDGRQETQKASSLLPPRNCLNLGSPDLLTLPLQAPALTTIFYFARLYSQGNEFACSYSLKEKRNKTLSNSLSKTDQAIFLQCAYRVPTTELRIN